MSASDSVLAWELPDVEPTADDTVAMLERLYALCAVHDLGRAKYEAAVMLASDHVLHGKPTTLEACHLTSEILLSVYCCGNLRRWPDGGGIIDDLGVRWTRAMFEAGLRALSALAIEALRSKEAA